MTKKAVEWDKPEGCNCNACPLNGQPFCPDEFVDNAHSTWVGESPGGQEVLSGRPFVGQAGKRLNKDVRLVGLKRSEANVINAVGCRPLKDKMTDSKWKTALRCCEGRVARALERCSGPVLAMGKWSQLAVTGLESIEKWMLYPLTGKWGHTTLSTPHPSRVLRQPWWTTEWIEGLIRFRSILEGTWESWEDPPIYWREPDSVLVEKLDALDRTVICHDAENAGCPGFADVLCYGVSDGNTAVSVVWPPSPPVRRALERVIWEAETLVAHNMQHDLLILEQLSLRYHPERCEDTLFQHSILRPDMPHNLGIATAHRWRAPRWKSIHKDEGEGNWATILHNARTYANKMDELCHYNGLDCYHGANLWKEQHAELTAAPRNKRDTYDLLTERSWVALAMRRRGIRVDMVEARRLIARFEARRDQAAARFNRLADAGHWPHTKLGKDGQTKAVRNLFLEHFKLYPLDFTENGNPRIDAWTLNRWANRFQADKTAAVAAKLILRYRMSAHQVGLINEVVKEIQADGKVHAAWNPSKLTDRWACSGPNLMNRPGPKKGLYNMRTMFVPDPGKIFVIADASQAELRVIAIEAGDQSLIIAFQKGTDVHQQNAVDLFGPGATSEQRGFGKTFVFSSNYGSSAETSWRQLVERFPYLKLQTVALLQRKWFHKHLAIKKLLERNLERARTEISPGVSQLKAPVGPRTWEFFMGQVDPNEVYNRPIQATVAWFMNRALCRLHAEGFEIVAFCHDEIIIQVSPHRKWAAAEALAAAMEEPVHLNGKPWVFPADPEQGDSWGAPQPLEEPQPCSEKHCPCLPQSCLYSRRWAQHPCKKRQTPMKA